jgi:hypothetical protein
MLPLGFLTRTRCNGEPVVYRLPPVLGPRLEHDPEKACPGLDPGWNPVFRKDHAQTKS